MFVLSVFERDFEQVYVVVVTFVSTWDRRKIKEKIRRDVFKGIDIQQVLAMNMVL